MWGIVLIEDEILHPKGQPRHAAYEIDRKARTVIPADFHPDADQPHIGVYRHQ